MSGTTSIYGLPFLEPDDPPDIAGATQDLAEATETELQRIDAAALGTMVGFESASEVAPQAIAASTLVAARWQAASSNVGPFGKPSAFEFTVPSAGVYLADVAGQVTTGQTERAFVQVLMAGRVFRSNFNGGVAGSGESGFSAVGLRRMSAGGIIKVELFCATAANLNGATLVAYRIGS